MFRIWNAENEHFNATTKNDAILVGVKTGKPFNVSWDAGPLWGWTEHYTDNGELLSKEEWFL